MQGFSLLEFLVVMLFSSIVIGIAGFEYRSLEDNINYSASDLVGTLKKARSKALSSTYFYNVAPTSTTSVGVTYGDSCTPTTPTVDNDISLTFPSSIFFTSITWSICFTPRGISSDSATIIIQNDSGATETIEVAVGGAMRIL